MLDPVTSSLEKLATYCSRQEWSGYDPFDGLNSRVFQHIPFLRGRRIFRLLFLQLNKKCPVNLRPILGVSKERNPKGIGLFLHGILNLYEKTGDAQYLPMIREFAAWLEDHASPGYRGKCWGYNFDWQSRAFFLPKGTPTVVNTSFIGRAFVKAYDVLHESEYLETARSGCDFILHDLNRLTEQNSVAFSYSPLDRYFVNNATALASSLLALVYSRTRDPELAEYAKKSAHFVVSRQHGDGSWSYGEDPTGVSVGIDNFHTGFILESLKIYSDNTGDDDYRNAIEAGLKFYEKSFFLDNGAPKYFPGSSYPLDIHSAGQAVVTLLRLGNGGAETDLCRKIVGWMIEHMQSRQGYFYYQKNRFYTNTIPYMRWGQAWAFRALSEYVSAS
jgi:hypothetical protein